MSIRRAAVADLFYPGDPVELGGQLSSIFSLFNSLPKQKSVAAIVPHAGYIYSGEAAAQAYAQIDFSELDCILLFGPAHRVPLKGLALPSVTEFETPLGNYPLAKGLIEQLVAADLATVDDSAHRQEHSLEVQIPFLQHLGVEVPLIPIVVGWSNPDEVSKCIEFVLLQAKALILVSSDLSHFHSYAEAQEIDQNTTYRILDMETDIQPEEACGCYALNGLLSWLKGSDKTIEVVSKYNSGDTAGDKDRVVGYASYIVYQ
ncbi:MAG: AmmeMemoRadiSam system protein B [Neptuniibacter sp.]